MILNILYLTSIYRKYLCQVHGMSPKLEK